LSKPSASRFRVVVRAIASPRDEWIILALAGFLFFIATNTQTGWLYAVVSFLLGLLVVGFFGPRATLRGLRVDRAVPSGVLEGQAASIRLTVTNPSATPRFLIGVVDAPPVAGAAPMRFVIRHLAPRRSVSFNYAVDCPRRGVLKFDAVTLESATPVGLFMHRRVVDAPAEMAVYPVGPEVRMLRVPAASREVSSGPRTQNRAGHSFDFLGIREYQWGDDTRFLHWPSTARSGRLMVREFEDPAADSIAILVENTSPSGVERDGRTALDQAARLAATLCVAARRDAATVTLLSDGPEEASVLANPRGDQALEWLARLNSDGRRTWVDLVRDCLDRLPRRARLHVLASEPVVDEEVLGMLAERRIRLLVTLFDATSFGANGRLEAGQYGEAIRHLREAGVSVRRIGASDPLAMFSLEAAG